MKKKPQMLGIYLIMVCIIQRSQTKSESFDCSARYKGVALTDYLLQGPDLLNSMVGVLI